VICNRKTKKNKGRHTLYICPYASTNYCVNRCWLFHNRKLKELKIKNLIKNQSLQCRRHSLLHILFFNWTTEINAGHSLPPLMLRMSNPPPIHKHLWSCCIFMSKTRNKRKINKLPKHIHSPCSYGVVLFFFFRVGLFIHYYRQCCRLENDFRMKSWLHMKRIHDV